MYKTRTINTLTAISVSFQEICNDYEWAFDKLFQHPTDVNTF